MPSKILYLVCNAHLDPVWLWEWEEGLGEALSTFRIACELCEEFKDFVFNHNESLLYQWVEGFDPKLFLRIRRLVREKRWHILGGWYLQPDCNLPSGEALVRQILAGRLYFRKKFGVEPRTAVNLDSFGHTRGLVQILKKSGYTSYLFCRPDSSELSLPAADFVWVGYDGSEILAHRARHHYNSAKGKAGQKIRKWIRQSQGMKTGLLLWGVGNHGGGASRQDLRQVGRLKSAGTGWQIRHGIPESYFKELNPVRMRLPRHRGDLNPWAVGCYTTMARVKQGYRQLENAFFLTEKMATHAALEGLREYPRRELAQALEDLLFCQFHDILPGSSISEVEESALRRLDHGLEILSRLKAQAFFALLSGQPRSKQGEFPIFVYNPHPFPFEGVMACEFQPQEPNLDRDKFWIPELRDSRGRLLPCQLEKENSNIAVDQRKRVVFRAKLEASQMIRFSCRLRKKARQPRALEQGNSLLAVSSDRSEVVIDKRTGLVRRYSVDGLDFLSRQAFRLLILEDSSDPWGMLVRGFRKVKAAFRLMTRAESARFAGISLPELEPVRVIEDGPVRKVVEALFKYSHSAACLRYKIPKKGSEWEIEIRVNWNEKDRMLKLSLPFCFSCGCCQGQVAFGVENYNRRREELAAHKWLAVVSADRSRALSLINAGTYGFDFDQGELRLSLLRSPAYAGSPVSPDIPIVRQDRFEPRIDQGERIFRFWIDGGSAHDRLLKIDREALVKNEAPVMLSCFPPGGGKTPRPGIRLSDEAVVTTAVKLAEQGRRLIFRLFEPTGDPRATRVEIPALDLSFEIFLRGFEVKTMAVDLKAKKVFEVNLIEQRTAKQARSRRQ